MANLAELLDSSNLVHLVGLIGLIVLVALGTLSITVGLPLITGLIGLGIPTASSIVAATKRIAASVAPPKAA